MEIKGYKILREINRGPITTVYQARQITLDRSVLLKVLNIQWKNERDLIARFRREAKICARLHHPNIVTVFDFGTAAEQFYISMEFVEGQTLADVIRDFRPLPVTVVLYLVHEILKGLDYAHRNGVIHRDIKPTNIMISEDGTVKISDFGMATIAGLPGVTEQGDALGSPAYISPEQALGIEIKANSDLFSLGATIYEMVGGSSPFKGANIAESINKTLNEKPSPLNSIHKDVPQWLSQMVSDMLRKEAKDRVTGCDRLLQQLEHVEHIDMTGMAAYLKNPQTLKPATFAESAKEVPGSKRKWLYAVVAALILLVFFFIVNRAGQNGINPDVPLADSSQTGSQKKYPEETRSVELISVKTDTIKSRQKRKEADRQKITFINEPAEKKAHPVEKSTVKQAEKAGLFVICNPWAEIYVDGKKAETTPLNEALKLAAGRHSVQLINPNYKTYSRQVKLNAAETDTLRVTLLPQNGALDLRVHPWAKVYIDNVYYETTPLARPIALTAGKHVLRFENPNFTAIIDTIEIVSGKTVQKRLHFGE